MKIMRKDGVMLVSPKETISFMNAEEMKDMILAQLKKEDKKLILDMAGINFVDSGGLGVLITLLKTMQENNGEFIITRPQLGVQKLIEMTKLDELIVIEKTEENLTGNWEEFDENGY
jgi:anti-sigma B factor antagonist